MEIVWEKTYVERIVGYRAKDGKMFPTRFDCEEYEESVEAAILAEYYPLVKKSFTEFGIFGYGYDDDEVVYHIIKINNAKELEIINKTLEIYNSYSEIVPIDYVGKIIMVYSEYGRILDWTTIERKLHNVKSHYDEQMSRYRLTE